MLYVNFMGQKNGAHSQTHRQNKIMKNIQRHAASQHFWASCRIRTNDPEITNHVLWPTELKRQVGELSTSHRSTRYPCFGQDLGDLRGASRAGLTRLQNYITYLIPPNIFRNLSNNFSKTVIIKMPISEYQDIGILLNRFKFLLKYMKQTSSCVLI